MEPLRVELPVRQIQTRELADPGDGEHLWITNVAFRVPQATIEAMKAGGPAGQIFLDHEAVLTLGMGCYKCEEPLSRRLLFRRCHGSMEPL